MLSKKLKCASIILSMVGIFVVTGFNKSIAAESIRIAVLDFEANDTSKFAAKAVSEFISTEMAKKSELTVIERTQIGAILNEQGFQQTGCTDQSCAVEMGKLLSAKKILLGTLTKTGAVFVITAKSVDVETGRIEFAESERCTKEEDLELASKILAVKLVNKITGATYTTPLRTYQQDENRNKFALGLMYRYGIIKNVNVPDVKTNFNSTKVTSQKADIRNQSAIISPSYEITDNFGIRMDIKYIYNKFCKPTGSEDMAYSENDSSFIDMHSIELNGGYGLALNLQLIYPIDGFSFFLNPGIGIDKYSFNNSQMISYRYVDSTILNILFQEGVYEIKADVYSYLLKIETGFSVYVSRYVDFYFSAGIDFHLFSELISDIKIKDIKVELISGSPPSEQQNILANTSTKFDGNFPPEYYAQAGVVLRLF